MTYRRTIDDRARPVPARNIALAIALDYSAIGACALANQYQYQ